ncbi:MULTISPECIES: BMP family lipoprotein [unclassified Streptomyces]|uniref:BMP family lipoprotein n=1 Tax=unclassified Streptomyces TaxID=2593676 RepID=UPI001319B693|nr:BMP family ABC transporter substrate-binding protein [Streptomyces sp. GS7]QHC25784.1 BMP family ABC transporter substrate-binding protein [Streptomyces sp. GS7]
MHRVSKIVAAGIATAALTLSLSACGASSTESGGQDKGVGLAFDVGGRDDHSFNEAAARGVDKAQKDFGEKSKLMTAKNGETEADREQRLSSLAEAGYNPVIGVGFNYGNAVNKVAKQYPKTTFGIVDSPSQAQNVYGMVFAEQEGSYLAGVAAALKSKTHQVGFIGGVNNALIQKFQAGFEQGVRDTDPKTKVTSEYLYANDDKGFNDPAAAKGKATGMLDAGIDVIYTAAGQSGNGSIETVAGKKGTWAIGVDSDQYLQPGLAQYKNSILTSVMKNVDVAVYDLIKSVHDKKPLTGNKSYTLKDDGVKLSTSGGFIDDIQAKIDEAKKKIASGQVKVSETPAKQ